MNNNDYHLKNIFTEFVLKPLNYILMIGGTFFLNHPVYAAENDTEQVHIKPKAVKSLSYAAPCEAVQPQSSRLKSIQKQLQKNSNPWIQNKQALLDEFWNEVKVAGTPLIEKIDAKTSRMTFLWRGAEHNVRLIGGPSNDHEWLTRLPDSDIWFKESIVDDRFIGSYSFAVDLPNLDGYLSSPCPHLNPALKESRDQRRAVLSVQKIDPFNPSRFLQDFHSSQFRNENTVSLTDAPSFVDPKAYPRHPTPQLIAYTLKSKTMQNERFIQIYQSRKKNPKDDYVTAIFFDGQQYSELLNVPKALDLLAEQDRLPPIQAIFVSHPSDQLRPKELTPNPAYTQFFIEELLSSVDHHLNHNRNKQKTVLLGSSLGGLSSAYLALKFPNEISHVVPLSGSFWWKEHRSDQPNGMSKIIREQLKLAPHQKPQQWYISANSYETSRNNNDISILDSSKMVADDLKSNGHQVHYQNYIGGHSYAVWQVVLQDALLHFFAKNKSKI